MIALRNDDRIIPARAGFTPAGPACGAPAADHPRSRGVYGTATRPSLSTAGSSPLARGLRGPEVGPRLPAGIIPARAGFTRSGSGRARSPRDHPRSRGVYAAVGAWPAASAGSSPLARGLQSGRVTSSHNWQDHPRSRGVYRAASGRRSMTSGSSPLARGLLDRGHYRRGRRGIIPARAGFTPVGADDSPKPGDHPRSRGVYLHAGFEHGVRLGIIPARAGFTDYQQSIAAINADHPRSRGVYSTGITRRIQVIGSSPLARGLRRCHLSILDRSGIIPARAGFTAHRPARRPRCRDHPRSRGVYRGLIGLMPATLGSSPLARGLHGRVKSEVREYRIIPARAGFTWHLRLLNSPSWDHPRSRGVYRVPSKRWCPSVGSSPLARGLHLRIPGIPTTSHTTRPRLPSLPT